MEPRSTPEDEEEEEVVAAAEEDEDEDERTLELPKKQTKCAQVRRIFNAIGADLTKLLGGLFR